MKQKNYDNCNGKEIDSTPVSRDDESIPPEDSSEGCYKNFDGQDYYRKSAIKYLFHTQVYGLWKRK